MTDLTAPQVTIPTPVPLISHDIGAGRPITVFRANPTSPYGRSPVETISTGGTFYSIGNEGDLGIYFKTPGEAQAYAAARGQVGAVVGQSYAVSPTGAITPVSSEQYRAEKTAREEAAKAAYGGVRTEAALSPVGVPTPGLPLAAKVAYFERGTGQWTTEEQFKRAVEGVGKYTPVSAKGEIVTAVKPQEALPIPVLEKPLYPGISEYTGYKPIDVSTLPSLAVKPARIYIEPQKYFLDPFYEYSKELSKKGAEYGEKYILPIAKYTPPGLIRPKETEQLARGVISGVATTPEFVATVGLGTEMIARDIITGKPVKEIGGRIGTGAALLATGMVTQFKEKPIETAGQFIGQSLVFGGVAKGIKEIKIPTIPAEKMFGAEFRPKYQPTALKIETEIFGKPSPIRPVTTEIVFGRGTIGDIARKVSPVTVGKTPTIENVFGKGTILSISVPELPKVTTAKVFGRGYTPEARAVIKGIIGTEPKAEPIQRISTRTMFGRGDIEKQLKGLAPAPKQVKPIVFGEYEGWSPISSPINIEKMSRVRIGKTIKPAELSVPTRVEVFPYGRYTELPKVTDMLKTPREEEIPIPKARMPEELPPMPKIRISEVPEAPRGKVFVQRDIGAELRQRWVKSQEKLEKTAKTGGFQVTRQGQIVLMEEPVLKTKLNQATIQIEKQIAKQELIQRRRLVPLILPILRPASITKQIQRTGQILTPKQMVRQRTATISSQKEIVALLSPTATREILKSTSVTEQIPLQSEIAVQISRATTKQAQQQEQILKQIQKQTQIYEVPEMQIPRLRTQLDVIEPIFRPRKKRVKRKAKVQKVRAPVLHPLWDIGLINEAKKSFKIIDITKKQKKKRR